MTFLRSIIEELYGPKSFHIILEAAMGKPWVQLSAWETDPKWHVNERGQPAEARTAQITSQDFQYVATPGTSISKAGYIFLPMMFAMDRTEGSRILMHIQALVQQGPVTVTGYPGYGIDEDGAYTARMYPSFNAEMKQLTQEQVGKGMVIHSINGEPLSRWMVKPIPAGVGAPGKSFGEMIRGTSNKPLPEWLDALSRDIDAAVAAGKVKVDISRTRGFEHDLILSGNGDAVLFFAKDTMARAAYVFKKKVDVDGHPTDFDVAVDQKMKELQSQHKRRPRGSKREAEPGADIGKAAERRAAGQLERAEATSAADSGRQPKLLLRDWLIETGNGYALRRDYRKEDIMALIERGVNFADAKRLAR